MLRLVALESVGAPENPDNAAATDRPTRRSAMLLRFVAVSSIASVTASSDEMSSVEFWGRMCSAYLCNSTPAREYIGNVHSASLHTPTRPITGPQTAGKKISGAWCTRRKNLLKIYRRPGFNFPVFTGVTVASSPPVHGHRYAQQAISTVVACNLPGQHQEECNHQQHPGLCWQRLP